MNIEKYQFFSGSTLLEEHVDPSKTDENICLKIKAGEMVTVKFFIQRVSREHAIMQKNLADMNRSAAKNGDACVGNCMYCESRVSCEKKKEKETDDFANA